MEKILAACGAADEDIQENALHCLREIAVQEYECVGQYFSHICTATGTASKSDNNKIGAAAFEFWTSLAEEEISRREKGTSNNYIKNDQATLELIQMILNGL